MPEIKVRCPICQRDDASSYSTDKGVGNCFRCNTAISAKQVGHIQDTFTEIRLLPELQLDTVYSYPRAVAYLHSRELPLEGTMFDEEENRLYFPIRPLSPEFFPSYHTRSILPYVKPPWKIFGQTKKEHYGYGDIAPNGRVCVCEGIGDACRLGVGGLSILGSRISDTQYAYLKRAKEILFWFDKDEAGYKCAKQAHIMFPSAKVIDYKEPGECLSAGNEVLQYVKAWLQD